MFNRSAVRPPEVASCACRTRRKVLASLPISAWNSSAASFPRVVPSPMVGAAAPKARLSALEWSIVAMAERDGMASIRDPGRVISALNKVFGFATPNRLANDRLESLRRIAIFAWNNGWKVPKSEIATFLSVGFTTDHFELVQRSIGDARSQRRRKTVR